MKTLIYFWGILLCATSALAAKFSTAPKVYPINKDVEISIECSDDSKIKDAKKIAVRYISADGLFTNNSVARWAQYENIPFEIKDGKIVFKFKFNLVGDHTFVIVRKPDSDKEKEKNLDKVKVYALSADMFALRPFKGQFHLHSKKSDGKNAPSEMVVKCLELGYDFMALSDHSNYKASIDLIDEMKKYPLTMSLYPAEEVHLNSCAHVQNFGGKISITDWSKGNAKEYQTAVEAKLKTLPEMPQESKYKLAQTCVAFDKIKASGGIAVFNHPYWKPNDRTTVDSFQRDAIYENGYADAIEVINDYDNDLLAFIKTAQTQAKLGKRINVVGNSDAHDKKNLSRSYTIIFAPTVSFADLANAIRTGKSLAVENSHKEKIILGNTELVQYAQFLEEEYFPALQSIRESEAKVLESSLDGNDNSAKFKEAAAKISKFKEQFWHK